MITRRRLIRLIQSLAVILIATVLGLRVAPDITGSSDTSARETVSLERIVDGDTIWVSGHRKIRLIGMNAPEIAHPEQGKPTGQPFGPEATTHLTELLDHKPLTLERDAEDKDKYGRLLRYVYVDGHNVSVTMVRDGYAQILTIPPDVKYQSEILQAEHEAQAAHRGIWQ